ncbi:FmdB family zinc ribbon protein [Lysobacter sp. A3-1-A15]|uniref:FmdB family zinc ribbon protein n=1 Tax=Novilysobacter viscosus TaxID=3098602 RepID=UPI002EDA5A9E
MPIYAFECAACGHRFDRLQKLSDADPTRCPQCEEAQVRRQLTAPQFRLAGGGWYETDFKKDGDTRRNLAGDAGSGEKAKPAEGGASGGDAGAKPEAKPSKPAESKPATPAKPTTPSS